MRAANIRSTANIPVSVLARHVLVNQTLFVSDLFAGPPKAEGNVTSSLVYLTTFNNGTLVLNRTIESIPAVPNAKTPVLYEVCVSKSGAPSGKQNVVNTQLLGTDIIAGKVCVGW